MRSLIFGNGRILICEDEKGIIRDVYSPQVGLENHGNFIRAGIYDLDNCCCSWFEDWDVDQKYKSDFKEDFLSSFLINLEDGGPDKYGVVHGVVSNIGETVFENPEMGLKVAVWDVLHPSVNIFYRVFEIKNLSEFTRNLRLFSNQNYRILENKIGETAVIDRDVLIHYKRNRYFLCGSRPQFDQFAVGTAEWKGLEGTWKEAEYNGELSGNVVAHGSVDSTLGWTIPRLKTDRHARIHLWIVIGKKYRSVIKTHRRIAKTGRSDVYHNSFNFWNSFIEQISMLPEYKQMHKLPARAKEIFYRSLLATVAHMDINGSVIASCDSYTKQFGADLYSYCWPRDAAWSCIALDKARYHHLSVEVFEFLSKIITDRGYFLHKYTPAGDFGSTWHPVPMIQIDETGLPLYAVYNNWMMSKNVWTTGRYFGSLVAPAANFLADSLNRKTGLPISSFDLWEERKGVHTYSACTVYAGLHGASELARTLGNDEEFERWSGAAEIVKGSISKYLYDEQLGRFKRSLNDPTIDSSLFAVWYFGVLPPRDKRVVNTMIAIEKELLQPIGGVARYENDSYHGHMNSWIICTLWLAQWHIAIGNFDRALQLIIWCSEHAHRTGLMPEQIAQDGSYPSVVPLMWSHCAFILSVLEYLEALR